METAQRVIGYVGAVAMLALLAGLARNRLYRVSYVFTAYIAAISLTDAVILAWPRRFYTWEFWLATQTLFGVLRFGSALELVAYTFQAFPGARAAARRTLLAGLVVILVALGAAPATGVDLASLAQELHPRLANGTALLFAGLWGLVLWYNLPIHPFHGAILRGLVPYLLVFTVTVRLLATWGWDVREETNLIDSLTWVLVVAYWARVAWRPESPAGSPAIVRTLQPWRDRL